MTLFGKPLRPPAGRSVPGRVSVSTVLARENNNFDLLRLLAASAVILGHSYALSPLAGFMDPVQRVLHFNYSGGVAVDLFFFLSGLLVMDSIRRNPSVPQFVLARAARVLPGLIVCLGVTCLVVGPLYTTLHLGDYFRQPATLSYYYVNLALTNLQWRLPGVFASSPWGLNGSLWTLPLEVRLYLTVAGFGLLRVWGPRPAALAALGSLVLLGWLWPAHVPYFLSNPDYLPPTLSFMAGALAAINKDLIPIRGDLACGVTAVAAAVVGWNYFTPAFYPCLFYLVLYVFQTKILRKLRLPGDYSYGVYIYGFVIQQCVASQQRNPNPHWNLLVSLPLALGAGVVSWHLVERPAMALFKRLPATAGAFVQLLRADRQGTPRTLLCCLGLPLAALCLPLSIKFLPRYGETMTVASDLVITGFGPDVVNAGQTFNRQPNGESAIWVQVSRPLAHDAQLTLGGLPLPSTVNPDGRTITALVPRKLYATAHALPLCVSEPSSQGIAMSNPVRLIVRNPTASASAPVPLPSQP